MDWRKLASDLALVDGALTPRRAAVIADELLAEGAVDQDEAAFLVALKRAAVAAPAEFDRLVYEVIRQVVLQDGVGRPAPDRHGRLEVGDEVSGPAQFARVGVQAA